MKDFGPGFPEWTELGQDGGLDPLGMQRPIEAIYQSLLPGISTITLRFRYYSFFVWMLEVYAREKGDTDPVAFRAFQRRCETLFALIAARGSTELGVAGIDWAQKQLGDVPNNPATIIDFSVGADPETDVGQRYLRNKGGAFGGIYATQMFEMGLITLGDDRNPIAVCTNRALPLAEAFAAEIGELGTVFILGEPPTDLLIDAASTYFPKSELHRFSDVGIFKVDASDSKRFVHAKLIIAQGQTWDHVISGSMNCTLPALLGPTIVRGNAEAGIYKRVPPGTALAALGLETYRDAPLRSSDLHDLASATAKHPAGEAYTDGGTMTLQSGRLVWKPPAGFVPGSAIAITLQGREEARFGNRIDLLHGGETAWFLDLDAKRPKSGIVHFADGSASAPVQVIDLDVLAVRTLPPAQGRKKSLTDILAEAMNEDLILIETLNQLEALEIEETGVTADSAPKALSAPSAVAPVQPHAILSYEEFVRARRKAFAQGNQFSGGLFGRHDSPANTLSAALNRIIGLVGLDLDADEDREMKTIAAMDFRMTEPATPNDAAQSLPPEEPPKAAMATKQAVATAKKMKEAVDAFEKRCRLLRGKPISTAELVRLRALLQILLSHAQPIQGAALPTQILPIHTKEGYDWPRLVGRLLKQHFGTARALQTLRVAQEEAEQKRVLEYLAMANWAAQTAAAAAVLHPKTSDLRAPLGSLAKALAAQVASVIGAVDEDRHYFNELTSKLDERFADRLALKPGVRLPFA